MVCAQPLRFAARAVESGRGVRQRRHGGQKNTRWRLATRWCTSLEEPPAAGPVRARRTFRLTCATKTTTLVISKQAGLVCHPSIDHADGTLVNATRESLRVACATCRAKTIARASCTVLTATPPALCLPRKNDATGLALAAETSTTAPSTAATWRACTASSRTTHGHGRRAHRPRGARAHAHGRARMPLGARRLNHVPRARALRAWAARQRIHAYRLQAVHRPYAPQIRVHM